VNKNWPGMCLEERGVIFKSVMNKEMPVVSAPSDIWLEPPRPQTNADIAFAPTSVAHLDVLDIYGPNVFENYRRVMQENSVSETQFLDGLNQDTTAFPTLPCLRPVGTSFPVFTGSECEVNEMQARSHAITFFNERGEPLVPWFKTVQQEECSKMEKEKVGLVSDPNLVATEGQPPALGYLKNDEEPVKYNFMWQQIPTHMLKSVRGALFDLKTPDADVVKSITCENRLPYILLVISVMMVLLALVVSVRQSVK